MKPRAIPKSLTDALQPKADFKLVAQLAAEMAEAMRLIHGGAWRILIDHETHFVVVRQR